MEKRSSFQQTVLEQLDIHMQKINLNTDFVPFTKINSKWVIDLNIKYKTIKLTEDNIRENLDVLGYDENFFRDNTKGKIHKRDNQRAELH